MYYAFTLLFYLRYCCINCSRKLVMLGVFITTLPDQWLKTKCSTSLQNRVSCTNNSHHNDSATIAWHWQCERAMMQSHCLRKSIQILIYSDNINERFEVIMDSKAFLKRSHKNDNCCEYSTQHIQLTVTGFEAGRWDVGQGLKRMHYLTCFKLHKFITRSVKSRSH
jgi:hypothetical protein